MRRLPSLRAHPRSAALGWLGGAALLLSACGVPEAGLHVVVTGTPIAGQDFDRLTIEVARTSDSQELATDSAAGEDLHALPMSFNFISGPTTPSGTELTVTARAYLGEAQVSSAAGTAKLAPKEGALLELVLPEPGTDPDGGDDAGEDAGDADGGEIDGGPPDGGEDGGGGTDAGGDGGADAGLDGGAPDGGLGSSCSAGTQCGSGQCADGVCCSSPCAGACNACNVPGTLGTCAPALLGSSGSPACSPYACDGVSSSCPTQCSGDAECTTGFYCRPNKSCAVKKASGQACGSSRECVSGLCVDGYCCNTSCGAACDRCDLAGSEGTCTNNTAAYSGAPSCSPYLCSGTSSACGSSCTTDASCSSAAYCVAPACLAKKTNGTSCSAAKECLTNLCVDGVCCNSACAGACDACNRTGSVGSCGPVANTSPGVPGCAPYLCSGTSPACATTCSGTGLCASGFPCSSTGVCMLKLALLTDGFGGAALDTAKWRLSQDGGAALAQRDGGIEMTLVADDAGYAAISSQLPWDAVGSFARVYLPTVGNQSLPSLEVVFAIKRTSLDRVAMVIQGSNITAQTMVAGGTTPLASIPYVATIRHLRIRESGGTTFFETSVDGGAFTVLTSTPNPMPMDEVYPELGAGTSAAEDGGTLVRFDDFNL